jgi:competence protein ComEC
LPTIEAWLAHTASGALLAIRAVAHRTAELEVLSFAIPTPTFAQLGALAFAALIMASTVLAPRFRSGPVVRSRRVPLRLGVFALFSIGLLLILEWQQVRRSAPRGTLRVTTLDVAQGDAALIDLPDGSLALVDAGGIVQSPIDPGRRVILPLLRSRRRTRIDVVVLSHAHPDHYLGLGSVLSEVEVGELWLTGNLEPRPRSEYGQLVTLARQRGVALRFAEELCRRSELGGAKLDVVAPCPGPDGSLSENDNSFVLRLSHGGHSALFAGDAEAAEESRVLAQAPHRLRATLLKVGHHGSRTSTGAAWLSQIEPRYGFISSGVRNRFGHPHVEPRVALFEAGVAFVRTDEHGSLVWETDGVNERLRVAR